jgi:putative toxin-antitoxin system antitoxin component (TIGR02293 family)
MSGTAAVTETLMIRPGALRLLGGPEVVVAPRRRASGFARGFVLKYRAVEQLGEFLDATTPQLMRVIEINERTAQRRREQGALTAEESDRLARVARVTDRAVDAFGDAEQAKAWLRTPNRSLQGAAPFDLLGTDSGAEFVTDELGRIEYGDLY